MFVDLKPEPGQLPTAPLLLKYLGQPSVSPVGLFLFLLLWLIWVIAPSFLISQALPLGFIVLFACNIVTIQRSRFRLALADLLPSVAVLMLWVMPAVQYRIEQAQSHFDGLLMQVDASTYFNIALPGVFAIGLASFLPLFISVQRDQDHIKQALTWLHERPFVLLLFSGIGLFCLLVGPYAPPLFRFPAYLGKTMLFIPGIYLFLRQGFRYRYLLLLIVTTILFLDALFTTMFGELAAWIMVLFIYKIVQERWAFPRILLSQVISLVFLFWLISFKYDYREQAITTTHFSDQVVLFKSLALQHIKQPFVTKPAEDIVARLNQGANMSLAFRHVPVKQDFVEGETIVTAIKSAFVPRLFWPDKPIAGGVENARRFMGSENLGYSINLGVVGESYVNYGKGGKFILFLFGYVLVFRVLYEVFQVISGHYPLLILFLPVVFLPFIFVEMDVGIVANHVVKASLASLFLVRLLHHFSPQSSSRT